MDSPLPADPDSRRPAAGAPSHTRLVPVGRTLPYALGYGLARQFPLLSPFQFPSLEHLDEAMAAAIREAQAVDGLSPKTATGYRNAYSMLRRFLKGGADECTFLSGQLPEQVHVLRGWIAWLRARRCNHTTVNHYWRMLHGVLKRVAAARGALDPTSAVAAPRPGQPHPRFLTREALERLQRFSEIAGVCSPEVDQVDFGIPEERV